jgi:3-hydroxyisobutyrate dehydrogenase-like beta-hydroxyacid dehydrogenase
MSEATAKGVVGYVGLGVMGMPYARHLQKAGHEVVVYDRDEATAARAAALGLAVAPSIAAVVREAAVVFTCLPNPEAVRAVYAEIGKPGLLAIDNSTVGPTLAREIHATLAGRGTAYVECPMLGGVGEAEAGELFLIVSGEAEAVARALPLVLVAAREHRVVGGPGTASLFKSVQNGLGLVQITAIAEALALVASAGGDLDAFIDVVGAGGGMAATPLFRAKAPMMRQVPADAVGKLYIGAKDAALAADLAAERGLDLPLFTRSRDVYRAAIEAGLAEQDISAIAQVIETATGATIRKD